MATASVYAANVNFDDDRRIARWRPLLQVILAVPHLIVARALSSLRGILTLIMGRPGGCGNSAECGGGFRRRTWRPWPIGRPGASMPCR
jgi:hypothetical protein